MRNAENIKHIVLGTVRLKIVAIMSLSVLFDELPLFMRGWGHIYRLNPEFTVKRFLSFWKNFYVNIESTYCGK